MDRYESMIKDLKSVFLRHKDTLNSTEPHRNEMLKTVLVSGCCGCGGDLNIEDLLFEIAMKLGVYD